MLFGFLLTENVNGNGIDFKVIASLIIPQL